MKSISLSGVFHCYRSEHALCPNEIEAVHGGGVARFSLFFDERKIYRTVAPSASDIFGHYRNNKVLSWYDTPVVKEMRLISDFNALRNFCRNDLWNQFSIRLYKQDRYSWSPQDEFDNSGTQRQAGMYCQFHVFQHDLKGRYEVSSSGIFDAHFIGHHGLYHSRFHASKSNPKADQIKDRAVYEVAMGKSPGGEMKKAIIRVVQFNPKTQSWLCKTDLGKELKIKDPKRFLQEVNQRAAGPQKPSAPPKPAPDGRLVEQKINSETKTGDETQKRERTPRADGKVSGLEAAFIVLKEAREAMNIKQIMDKINECGLAKLNGKTPDATISAALQREINSKGENSRFVKEGKGLFRAK